MKTRLVLAVLAVAASAACSKEAAPPPPPAPKPAAEAPAPAAAPVATPTAAPVPPQAPPTPPMPPRPPMPGPGARPEGIPPSGAVLPTGHAKVGDAKCRMCHRLQHDSWSASPHAAKGLDCEGCHGGGADFIKVMRDRTAAVAAGLLIPKRDFCQRCHKDDWQDAMFLRVHAHKAK